MSVTEKHLLDLISSNSPGQGMREKNTDLWNSKRQKNWQIYENKRDPCDCILVIVKEFTKK